MCVCVSEKKIVRLVTFYKQQSEDYPILVFIWKRWDKTTSSGLEDHFPQWNGWPANDGAMIGICKRWTTMVEGLFSMAKKNGGKCEKNFGKASLEIYMSFAFVHWHVRLPKGVYG